MANFELDLREFERAIQQASSVVARGAKRGLDDIRDDWLDRSETVTPVDTTHLKRQTEGEVEGNALNNMRVILRNDAQSDDGFNYAYYIHEEDFGGKTPRNGKLKKFLDQPLEENIGRYENKLQSEIEEELRRQGW